MLVTCRSIMQCTIIALPSFSIAKSKNKSADSADFCDAGDTDESGEFGESCLSGKCSESGEAGEKVNHVDLVN